MYKYNMLYIIKFIEQVLTLESYYIKIIKKVTKSA